jgi:hypothetical protein
MAQEKPSPEVASKAAELAAKKTKYDSSQNEFLKDKICKDFIPASFHFRGDSLVTAKLTKAQVDKLAADKNFQYWTDKEAK